MDPHYFFANPDPAIHLIADPDPDPAAFKMWIRIQPNKMCKKLLHKKSKFTSQQIINNYVDFCRNGEILGMSKENNDFFNDEQTITNE